jgi:adenylate cyclase
VKYRTKLYLVFIAVILCTTFAGLSLMYWESHHILYKELQTKILTVASSAAEGIDGDLLETIRSPQDADTAAFKRVTVLMEKIKDVNRRPDLYVIWIYTLMPNPQHPKRLEIGIDTGEAEDNVYIFSGEPYPEGLKYGLENHLDEAWATPQLYTDRWGTFLSGFAPIYDSKGRYVATLGVDLTAGFIETKLLHLKVFALAIVCLTLLGGVIAATFLSRIVTRSLDLISGSVRAIGAGDLKTRVHIDTSDEFGDLARAINAMAQDLEEHERLKLNFVRYVSKHIMEKIISSDYIPALKGERRQITVLFSDIREFTHLSEQMPPEEVVALLNEYLDKMLAVIFKHNGTLDKFMGDGLMVEFGAPLDDPLQEKNAVETAIEMQQALKELSYKWNQEGRPQLRMGIGIHTGPAIVGTIGSDKRMEYTAIGDTVNVASLLEQATKKFKVPILISETTFDAIKGTYPTENLGSFNLPGRQKEISIYTIKEKETGE